jgi:hypothetical protein
MAGSHDDHPPVLLFPADYEFAAIGQPDEHFAVYKSTQSGITKTQIVDRLRAMADRIENGET